MALEAHRALTEESLEGQEVIKVPLPTHEAAGKVRKSSTIPRHREISEDLARKICRDLDVPNP